MNSDDYQEVLEACLIPYLEEHDDVQLLFQQDNASIHIEDIAHHNFGPLFSNITLWELFNIDEINEILKKIKHDERKVICFSVPDYEADAELFQISMVVKNVSKFDTTLTLKRQKVCSCKLVEVSKGISIRDLIYECPHRPMFKMEMSEQMILAENMQLLNMKIKYLEMGLTPMSYLMELSNNRRLELFLNINSLPPHISKPSIYLHKYELQLKSVFLGEIEPCVQVLWLYNNSASKVTYKVDVNVLNNLTDEWKFNILKCLNPKGVLESYTSYPLMFDFMPIEAKIYTVNIPVRLGNDLIKLTIVGEGSFTYYPHFEELLGKMPTTSKMLYIDNPISLSVNHLLIDPFPVWSRTEKMFFIKNMTKDRVIGYSWQKLSVDGLVEAYVLHRKGVLEPKESHPIVVRIISFDLPCRLRLQLPCKLLDHTQHYLHKQSVMVYNLKQEELDGQFTITENGINYPENDVVILPQAQVFYTTVALSVHVISTPDRDLGLDINQQMKQSPNFDLPINISRLLEEFHNECPKAEQKQKKIKQKDDLGVNKENLLYYKNVAESILTDAVFSDIFTNIVKELNTSNPPYYLQFKMNTSDNFFWKYSRNLNEDIEKTTISSLNMRTKMMESFLKQPLNTVLTEVLKELILDSLHEVFQLGPPTKSDTLGRMVQKSKFTCNCTEIK